MGSIKPFKHRPRKSVQYPSAADAQRYAEELFAVAEAMAPGTARQSVLKEACDYRWLAEMKRLVEKPTR